MPNETIFLLLLLSDSSYIVVLAVLSQLFLNYKRHLSVTKRQLFLQSYKWQFLQAAVVQWRYISFIMEPAKKSKINAKRRAKRSSETEEQKLARLAKLREKRSSETE